MRVAWLHFFVVISVFFACVTAQAQRGVLIGENDVIAGTDRDYTNGIRSSFVYDDFAHDVLAGRAFAMVRPALITLGTNEGAVRQQFEWIALGQSIFTPDKTTMPLRAPGDRPFGGWLYTGFNASQETGRHQLDSFEFLAGAVGGSASLAGDAQGLIHRWLGETSPVINGYELHNEPGFLVAWDRRWKFGVSTTDGYGVDIIPAIGFTGGNVFTYGSAGAIARIGRSLGTTWGPTLIRPAPSSADFFSPDPGDPYWGFDAFGGFEARAMAHNIFLDGNTIDPGLHVTRKPLVLDMIVGAEVFTRTGHSLTLSVIRRSLEYTTQTKASTFGSFALGLHF